jgi:hypothetical protein
LFLYKSKPRAKFQQRKIKDLASFVVGHSVSAGQIAPIHNNILTLPLPLNFK